MGLNYFASSPVLLPPTNTTHHLMSQSHHEGGAVLEPSPAAFQQQHPFSSKKFVSRYPRPPSLNYLAQSSTATAGRKRSRDDIADELEHELDASSRPIAVEPPKPEPILGPGMTLIYPDEPSLNISPESQSGTWMEEKADEETTRPRLIARKSQRTVDDQPANSYHEEIDPVVRQLGIGWKQLSVNQASAIAGSETFIKKQFSLDEPRIFLHHEGLGIYVVRSDPVGAKGYWQQWWLFRDDLKSCRFLSNDDNDLFRRLNHKRQDERGNWIPHILVEGPEVFAKDVPPSPVTALSPINGVAHANNVEQMLIQQRPCEDVEMEGVA